MIREDFPRYAYDDDLIAATRADGRPRVRVYRLAGTVVVLGSGSRPEVEVDLEACRADRVPVLRRRGGGCAVVLDPGNVIVSTVLAGMPHGHHRQHFDRLTQWLIDGLAAIGVPDLRQAGICDLALREHKVGGACVHRFRDLLYYSVSLLVAPDIARVGCYLRHPPREPAYRGGRSHRAFMGSLEEVLGGSSVVFQNDLVEGVAQRLRETLTPPTMSIGSRALSGNHDQERAHIGGLEPHFAVSDCPEIKKVRL